MIEKARQGSYSHAKWLFEFAGLTLRTPAKEHCDEGPDALIADLLAPCKAEEQT